METHTPLASHFCNLKVFLSFLRRRVCAAEALSSALADDVTAAESRADGQVARLQSLVFPLLELHKELATSRREAEQVYSACEADLEELVRLQLCAVVCAAALCSCLLLQDQRCMRTRSCV